MHGALPAGRLCASGACSHAGQTPDLCIPCPARPGLRSIPKMRVLNSNNGALTYNRCTACDVSELKCKVGRAVRAAGAMLAPCTIGHGMAVYASGTGPAAAIPPPPSHTRPMPNHPNLPAARRMPTRAPLAPTAPWTAALRAGETPSSIPFP